MSKCRIQKCHYYLAGPPGHHERRCLFPGRVPGGYQVISVSELVVPAEVTRVSEVTSFVEKALASSGADPSVTMPLVLSAEEAFVNIASYAYPGRVGGRVIVRCEVTHETARLILSDEGVPFNPLMHPVPDITEGIEDRRIGGLGILMIRRLSDEVEYSYSGGKNILTITRSNHHQ